MKFGLNIDVFTAARERVKWTLQHFAKTYVSFSGGKDSGVMLQLVIDTARELGMLPVHVLVVDLEAQYALTAAFVARQVAREEVVAHWVCLPLHLRNSVSQFKPFWLCWDPNNRPAWVRDFPDSAAVVKDEGFFPFFERGMEFEDFVPLYGDWFAEGQQTACFVGIRSDESLNRLRTIRSTSKVTVEGKQWTTKISDTVTNVYPIYDWRTEDLWTATAKQGWDYNRVYDLMHLAGLSIHEMRLCQPYGDDQRKGLWLFKILEPETWAKVVARVEGVNFGQRHASARILGRIKVDLPEGMTWKGYTEFLLQTMPPPLAEHYRKKILVFLGYWAKREDHPFQDGIPDAADPKLEATRKAPSWRRVAKVILKNDYWCKGLSFSMTKKEHDRRLAAALSYMSPRPEGEGGGDVLDPS